MKLQKYADKYAIAHRDLTIVNEHTPHLICAWIKYYCGKPRSTCDRAANISDESIPLVPYNRGDAHSWSAASTMRAAASYMYIMKQSRQASSFQQSTDCKWLGNPCNSTFVRQYMKALKRQKVLFPSGWTFMTPTLTTNVGSRRRDTPERNGNHRRKDPAIVRRKLESND